MPSANDVAHLLRRAGFGATRSEIDHYAALPEIEDVVQQILEDQRLTADLKYSTPPPVMARPQCSSSVPYYQTLALGRWFFDRMAAARFDAKQPAVPHPLREKMTLFWHGLLVSSLEKDQIYCTHRTLSWQHLMFRRHAVGPYRTLLEATSKDPAMLLYLDNWVSTVDNPNENYARELLELFSLGVGNYSQAEVVAAARAGTGYGLALNAKENKFTHYQYSGDQHDHGNDKQFFGITGNWDLTGDSADPDARNLVAYLCASVGKGHVTARMLSKLMWEYFAHFAPDGSLVDELAAAMTASGQVVISDGLRAIFTHPQFYSAAARSGKVKNPIEWSVMVLRALSIRAPYFPDDRWDPLQQGGTDAMGLQLFFPASVFGWWRRPETRWIGMSPLLAKAGVIDAVGYRLRRNPKHAVWKLLDLTPDETIDGLLALFNVETADDDPSRTAALELLQRLRADEVDRVTLAVTLLKFIAVSPAAQVN
jgi:uncharacterized protein (DUF1800 family)